MCCLKAGQGITIKELPEIMEGKNKIGGPEPDDTVLSKENIFRAVI